jgi:hypothetical protein
MRRPKVAAFAENEGIVREERRQRSPQKSRLLPPGTKALSAKGPQATFAN